MKAIKKLKYFFVFFTIFIPVSSFAKVEVSELQQLKPLQENKPKTIYNGLNGNDKNEISYQDIYDSEGELVKTLLGKSSKVTSLMFSDNEILKISDAIDALKNNRSMSYHDKHNLDGYVHLNSIIFSDFEWWAVWINNKKITSKTNNKSDAIYIQHIDHDSVNIVWNIPFSKWKILSSNREYSNYSVKFDDKNNAIIKFSLMPNQTYALHSNQVIEGFE